MLGKRGILLEKQWMMHTKGSFIWSKTIDKVKKNICHAAGTRLNLGRG